MTIVHDNDRFVAIAKVFAKDFANFPGKNSISLIVRALWRVWEVESYALSKFQTPTTLGRSIDRIEMNVESIESKKRRMQLSKELSRTSWDSFESESDSKESWDDQLNSFKSGVSKILRLVEYRIDRRPPCTMVSR